jgi:hypothetical protein
MRTFKFRVWDTVAQRMINEVTFSSFAGSRCPTAQQTLDALVVMQYTGCRDSQGKPVYEADICRYRIEDERRGTVHEEVGAIRFASGCFTFGNTPLCELGVVNDRLPLEVIGNCYEHPDLLADIPSGATVH